MFTWDVLGMCLLNLSACSTRLYWSSNNKLNDYADAEDRVVRFQVMIKAEALDDDNDKDDNDEDDDFKIYNIMMKCLFVTKNHDHDDNDDEDDMKVLSVGVRRRLVPVLLT